MEVKPHKKLTVWQKAIDIADEVYKLTEHFPEDEKYGLSQQMRRAAVSIASNIAEGAARSSYKEKVQFFTMARSSLSELDTQIEIVKRLPFGSQLKLNKLNDDLEEVSRMLNGLIKSRKKLISVILSFIASTFFSSSLFIATCFIATSLLCAGVGTTGGQFLKIGPSARALGMAGAFGAISDDVYALHFNPAGLTQLEKEEVSSTYLRYFVDVNYGFIGYARPTKIGTFGLGWTYLVVDKIEKRDTQENLLGEFNVKDQAITFAYAKQDAFPKLLEGLNLGANLRFISSEIDQNMAYTASIDFSAMYKPIEKLNTAVAIQNISWGIRYKDKTDMLPLNLKFAVAYKMKENLLLASDIDAYLIDTKFYVSLGTEFCPMKHLLLRAGYRYGYDIGSLGSLVGFGVGLGFRIWNLGFDYAFVPFGELGDTHRVSFTIKF